MTNTAVLVLNRPALRHLAESEPEQLKAIGATCWHETGPWSLCATDPDAKAFPDEGLEAHIRLGLGLPAATPTAPAGPGQNGA